MLVNNTDLWLENCGVLMKWWPCMSDTLSHCSYFILHLGGGVELVT